MKTGLVLALLSAMILLSSTCVAIGQAWYNSTSPWSQSQYDAQHTAAGNSTSPSSNSTIWIYDDSTHYGAPSGFVVGDGRVFGVRTDGGSLFVLDETTGVSILGKSIGLALNPTPAYSDGKVYLTSGNYLYGTGSLRCYNATTGDELWNYDTTPGQIYHPPTVSGNRVYVGTRNNYTYCIEDGVLKWYKKLGGPTQSAPAVDGDLLCIGCDDGKVYAFNITDQPVSMWNFTISTTIRSPITIEGEKVYCASSDGCLYVLDRTNGQLIWSWQSQSSSDLSITVAYGIVYVSPNIGSGLYALYSNATAGNYTYSSPEPRVWGDGTTWGARYGISIAGGKLFYVEGNSNLLRARNAWTGTNLWSFSSADSAPIVADGHVFVAGNDKVYCFGASYPSVTNTYDLDVGGQPFTVDIETNSTVGNIDVSDITTTMNMSFTVESSQGTGMCNVTLPNNMLGEPYNVTIDGQDPWSSVIIPINATHTSLYLTYNGTGKYTVEIAGSTAIHEFTLPIAILSCGIIALAVTGLRKKRLFT